MHALNLGILAHVDAGKTSLTERLLYAAGVIDTIGRVDDGNTQTDSLALERQRGITIKSAVASFNLRGLTINLIDTPGHPDFIAEVERVLSALDGVILVISAVEGVQAQTRVLMRTLQRLRIPSLIFVNKIDRGGANYDDVLRGIADKLTPAAVSMGTVSAQGTRTARFDEHDGGSLPARLLDVLTRNDDALLAEYVTNRTVTSQRLRNALVAQTRNALVHPVFAGSAVTGAGIEQLTAAITELLPVATGDPAATVRGTAFKVERGPAGQKVALVRLSSGTVHTRDRLQFGDGGEAKVSAINVFHSGSANHSGTVEAGQIARLWGLDGIQVGDSIGGFQTATAQHYFAPPTLETAVVPVNPRDKGALHTALSQLAEQDPLINLRQDDRGELFLSLYGEVQKEVIQAPLIGDYGIAAEFRETTMICIERPIGRGHALEEAPDPFVATIGLRVEPRDIDSDVEFRLAVDRGSIPAAFFTAVEDAVRETLRQGLHGWRVTDCTVTMTHSIRYRDWAQSNPSEHRRLTPLVLMAALHDAGTVVCEPVHRFTIEAPPDAIAPLLTLLAKLQALTSQPRRKAFSGVTFLLPAFTGCSRRSPASPMEKASWKVPSNASGRCAGNRPFAPEPDRIRSTARITSWGNEVARTISLMTLHGEGLKAEVGVRELHDRLSRYIRHVDSGGDVVVTMRGRRVARLSGVDVDDPLTDLRARGLVSDPQQPRQRMREWTRLTASGSISDLVSEQRR